MHELAISEGLIALIEQRERTHGFQRVRRVRVEIGRLSSIFPDSMRLCFAAVSRGTVAAEAELDLVDVPGQGVCARCQAHFAVDRFGTECPDCGGCSIAVTGGTGVRLKDLVVE